MNELDVLIRLSQQTGVSGFEKESTPYIVDEFRKYCDEVVVDTVGNIIALKKGIHSERSDHRPIRIMFTAHMDEIGLMVTHIETGGFVRFTTVGGIDQRVLLAQEVIIRGREEVYGVIGNKPPHLSVGDEMKEAVKRDDMAINTGFPEARLRELIKIGDPIGFRRTVMELQNGNEQLQYI